MSRGFSAMESPAPATTEIELDVARWFAQRLGLPTTGGGCVTSGDAMATFVALKTARDARAGWSIRDLGTRSGPPLTVYSSERGHDINARAADMLGLGREAVRIVGCDDAGRLRVDALRAAVAHDIRHGYKAIAAIATAGSAVIGAIDPIEGIADVCAEHQLWLHVDASSRRAAALTDGLRRLFRGIERADSLALDAHAWLHAPHPSRVVLVRDRHCLVESFMAESGVPRAGIANSGSRP